MTNHSQGSNNRRTKSYNSSMIYWAHLVGFDKILKERYNPTAYNWLKQKNL